jgi:hypothetical protein
MLRTADQTLFISGVHSATFSGEEHPMEESCAFTLLSHIFPDFVAAAASELDERLKGEP